jgi:transcriptional regulator with XRE-family HTH domain
MAIYSRRAALSSPACRHEIVKTSSGGLQMDDQYVQPHGETLRQKCHAQGWTQEQLADETGLRKRTVERAEAGKRLQRRTLQAIASALRTPPEDLLHAALPPAPPAPEQLPPPIRPIYITPLRGIPSEAYKQLAQELGVTQAALHNFFQILKQQLVPPADLDATLRAIAAHYKTLLERVRYESERCREGWWQSGQTALGALSAATSVMW